MAELDEAEMGVFEMMMTFILTFITRALPRPRVKFTLGAPAYFGNLDPRGPRLSE